MEKCTKIILEEQEDYKRKKLENGEYIDITKMHNAINKRKKIKQLNKLLTFAINKNFADTRDMINRYKEEHKEDVIFYFD